MLILNKDDLEFVTEFPCFFGTPCIPLHINISWKTTFKYSSLNSHVYWDSLYIIIHINITWKTTFVTILVWWLIHKILNIRIAERRLVRLESRRVGFIGFTLLYFLCEGKSRALGKSGVKTVAPLTRVLNRYTETSSGGHWN